MGDTAAREDHICSKLTLPAAGWQLQHARADPQYPQNWRELETSKRCDDRSGAARHGRGAAAAAAGRRRRRR